VKGLVARRKRIALGLPAYMAIPEKPVTILP